MKFSIRGILAITLLVAIVLHAVNRWTRISAIQREISALQLATFGQMFDGEYVAGSTAACRNAIRKNAIPSPYFVAAQAKYDRVVADQEKSDQEKSDR